jgi:outer membrane lipoprotein-sorting protein
MSRKTFFILILLLVFLAACKSDTLSAELWIGPVENRQQVAGQSAEVAQDLSTPFEVRFSQAMDPDSISPPVFIQPAVAGRWTWSEDNTIASFELSSTSRLLSNREYTLRVHPNLLSEGGESFEEPPQWTVSSAPTFEVDEREADGDGRTLTTRLTFSLPADHDSVEAAVEVDPPVELDLSWDEDTLVIETAELLVPGQRYHFTISSDARSTSGQSLQTEQWYYSTPGLLNSIIYPYSSGMDSRLRLRFNYPLDWEAAIEALRFDPPVDGSFSVDEDRLEMAFQPDENFRFGTTYTLRSSQPLLNPDGSELGRLEENTFTTPSPIHSVEPQPWETIYPGEDISISFEFDMNIESVEQAFSIDPPIEGEFDSHSQRISFRPVGGFLEGNTTYTVTIDTSALDSQDRPVLSEPYQYSFTTTEMPPAAYFGPYPNVLVTYPQASIEIEYQVTERGASSVVFDLYELTPDEFVARYVEGYRAWSWEPTYGEMWVGDAEHLDQWIQSTADCDPGYYTCSHPTNVDGSLPGGLYMLTVSTVEGEIQDQLLVAVTERLVTAKTANGQVTAWVTNHAGVPIPGAEVRIYADNGGFIESGLTDADGIYQTWVFGGVEPAMVVAEIGDDITVTGLSRDWRTGFYGYSGMFGFSRRNLGVSTGPVRLLAHIHTDRPIYRPGQTVYFKGILRQDQDALIGLLDEGTPATVRLLDARDNVIDTLELETLDFPELQASLESMQMAASSHIDQIKALAGTGRED